MNNIVDLRFKHPATIFVNGPTSCGKTVLVRKILKFHKKIFNIKKEYKKFKVLWCHGQEQACHKVPISKDVEVTYYKGFPSQTLIERKQFHMIIIDDLMNESKRDNTSINLFTKGSHHMNVSVLFISQNIFDKAMRLLTLNSHYIIYFKNPRDCTQIRVLSYQINPSNPKFLIDAYEDATSEPFGYIRADLTQETKNEYRFITDIIPREENNYNFDPIIYLPCQQT